MKCPRCKSLCTPQELAASSAASYTKSQLMVVTSAGQYVLTSVADTLGLDGRKVWTRREVTRQVCAACCEELGRGKLAHSSRGKGAWQRKERG